jgi:hypothetical protein
MAVVALLLVVVAFLQLAVDRLPAPLRALGTAAGTTLLLAGLLSPWWLAVVLFATVLAVRLVRQVRAGVWLARAAVAATLARIALLW